MVRDETQRRDHPSYSLEEVRRLAGLGKVQYATAKVEWNAEDLEYSQDEVCRCLCSLTPEDFHESILYPDAPKWLDVYLIEYRGPRDVSDRLYIKLRIGRNAIAVNLFSFHLEGRF